MTDSSNRLPFVVAYAADAHGCGWHRILSPAQAVVKSGAAWVRTSHTIIPVEDMVAAKPDVVVFQRQVEEGQIEYMRELREKLPSTKFIYELDDLLSQVDPNNYHEPFLAPGDLIDARIAEAMSLCDGAVTPTEGLASWLRGLAPKVPVTVLPNLLGELDGDLPQIVTKPQASKLRVGWAGGISHDGDLEQLVPAIKAIATGYLKDKVQFVFMGMRPKGLDESLYEFHGGVPPHEFGKAWASKDLDVILAPIEDNDFNRGKSNLRLVQAGMCGAAVIASPVGVYNDCGAVMAYAETTPQWCARLDDAINMDRSKLSAAKQQQRTWAMSYAMQKEVQQILTAWQVPAASAAAKRLSKKFVVWGIDAKSLGLGDNYVQGAEHIADAYQEARKAGSGLIVARAMTDLSAGSLYKLVSAANETGVASATPLSNDGQAGASIFAGNDFRQMSPEAGAEIEAAISGLARAQFPLPFPLGPVTVLSPRAVARVTAFPEAGGLMASLAEWGLVANATGLRSNLVAAAWATAMGPEGSMDGRLVQAHGVPLQALQQFLGSQEMNAFRLAAELTHLKQNHKIPVVPGSMPQALGAWSAFFGGPKLGARSEPKSLARVMVGDQESFEEAIQNVKYIRFDFDEAQIHDAALAALEEFAEQREAAVAYADWVAIPKESGPKAPAPVPVLLPEAVDANYLLGRDAISATAIVSVDALKATTSKVPQDRNAVWLLLTHMASAAPEQFAHYARNLAIGIENMDTKGRIEILKTSFPGNDYEEIEGYGLIKVKPTLRYLGAPKVSVVIPTSGNRWLLRPCLATLAKNTDYPGEIEVILVLSGTGDKTVKAWEEVMKIPEHDGATIVALMEDFNFSKACNEGAARATGEYIVFVNDDVRFATKGWLEPLVAKAMRTDTAWVQPRLVKQDGSVQCAGIYAGNGIAFENFKGVANNDLGFGGMAHVMRNTGAACAACAVISKEKFLEIGGFEEAMPWNYNDVLAGYEARQRGYSNVVVASVEVMHLESASRGKAKYEESVRRLRRDGIELKKRAPLPDTTWPEALQAETVWRGLAAVGSRMETLAWDDSAQGKPSAKRILALGTNLQGIGQAVRKGDRVFVASIRNEKLRFENPSISVFKDGISLAQPEVIKHVMGALGIDEIHLLPTPGEETILPDTAKQFCGVVVNGVA